MGFWSTLGKIGLGAAGAAAAPFTGGASLMATLGSAGLGAAGAASGAFSQSQANNRGEKYGGQIDLERLLMERERNNQTMRINREQEGRASSSDAFRKLLASTHLLSPGSRPQLSPYSVKPRAVTTEEMRGSGAMIDDSLRRLEGGNPIPQVTDRPVNVDPNLLNAGWLEQITGVASPALGIWSQYLKSKANKPKSDGLNV